MGAWLILTPFTAALDFDYAHLTRKGSIVMGELYFKALMKGFAAWLEEHGRRQSPGQ